MCTPFIPESAMSHGDSKLFWRGKGSASQCSLPMCLPEKREGWFAQRVREGVQVTISHPKIIETGIDLLNHSSLIFFESGYSLHTLRQASRRSWRIGQRQSVRVFYLHYEETMQSSCLRLMGKKLLVSLAMEGKFSREGLQSLDEDDDMLTAMARELVTQNGVGESAAAVVATDSGGE